MKRRNTAPDAGATMTESPVFATYLEAHDEATRRRTQEAEWGFVVQVAKAPYGGYYVRSWPEEFLVDPALRPLFEQDEPEYQDL